MYKKILIPVALDHQGKGEDAMAVAKRLKADAAEVILLHVLEEIPGYVLAEIPASIFETANQEALVELKKIADNAGVAAQCNVLRGHAGVSIVDFAEKHGIDLIVIASHKPGLADYFLGSTAARVVRHAPCSVHVMR